MSYMFQLREYAELGAHMQELLEVINPEMKYQIVEYIYYK